LVKANPKYISVNWEASGGGAFGVIPVDERGKLPDLLPLFRGHTGAVLDTDWNPFDDSVIASGSDDAKVMIWRVPENFTLHTDADEPIDVAPIEKLSGHTRKVGHVLFNPSAANVLASSSGDYTVKLWDVEAKTAPLTLKHADIVQSLSWSADGGMLVTTCRDKKLRFWDVRQQKPAHEVPGHAGAKSSRVVWMGEHDRVATTGFSRMSDRQLGLWDMRSPKEPIGGFTILDSISGVCMPFWDDGTQMLYLAGKGDGNIRYYEYANDKFEYLSEHKSSDPQRGIAFVPKRGVNTHENEIMRAYKTVNETFIEPVSFVVPRRAEVFQNDIYPPTTGTTPSMSSADFFAGKETSLPPKFSLENLYDGTEVQNIPAAKAPSPAQVKEQPAPSVTPPVKAATPTEPTPAPSTARAPPPSVNDNKASMASMASKFADKDGKAEDEDDSSSFEEIPKPVVRPTATKSEEKTSLWTSPNSKTSATKTTSAEKPEGLYRGTSFTREQAEPAPAATATSAPASDEPAKSNTNGDSTSGPTSSRSVSGAAKGAADGIRGMLQELKSMIASQAAKAEEQGEKIEILAREVASLKSRLGEA